MDDCNDYLTLSQKFDNLLKTWEEIENSDQPTSSDAIQIKIKQAISELENLTVKVSYLGVFSSNESLQDISTNSLKFILLPLLLGLLHIMLCSDNVQERLNIAAVYLRDFLRRCQSYGLTNAPLNKDFEEDDVEPKLNEPESKPPSNKQISLEDLRAMSVSREEKIKRFRAKKELEAKLSNLRSVVNQCQDDEVLRDYFVTLINSFVLRSIEELDSISKEVCLLKQMQRDPLSKDASKSLPSQVPLRTFRITRDSLKGKVFGPGYPSLPVLSVEEFYNQKVQEGWFPSPSTTQISQDTQRTEDKEVDEDLSQAEDENERERLMQRDEWRDTHRTGWGNTYNRS